MKVAFFRPDTGQAVRIYSGQAQDVQQVLLDERFDGCAVRTLDGTRFADAMTLVTLPTLAEFDAG